MPIITNSSSNSGNLVSQPNPTEPPFPNISVKSDFVSRHKKSPRAIYRTPETIHLNSQGFKPPYKIGDDVYMASRGKTYTLKAAHLVDDMLANAGDTGYIATLSHKAGNIEEYVDLPITGNFFTPTLRTSLSDEVTLWMRVKKMICYVFCCRA